MILISILWYEGLQIKLACYKILNIKHWIHLDMFAQTSSIRLQNTVAYGRDASKARLKQFLKLWTLLFFTCMVYCGYFHILLQNLSFKAKKIYLYFLNDDDVIIQIMHLCTLKITFIPFHLLGNNDGQYMLYNCQWLITASIIKMEE